MAEEKKDNSQFNWLLWWRISEDDLENQIKNYDRLAITKSARGVSALLLLLSAVVTTVAISSGFFESWALFDVLIFSVLAVFIYRGSRWAMVIAMLIWTLEKLYMMFDQTSLTGSPIISIIWWAVYMHAFWLAFRVEQERKGVSNNPAKVSSPSSISDLEELAELKDKGIITKEEFSRKKAKILDL